MKQMELVGRKYNDLNAEGLKLLGHRTDVLTANGEKLKHGEGCIVDFASGLSCSAIYSHDEVIYDDVIFTDESIIYCPSEELVEEIGEDYW